MIIGLILVGTALVFLSKTSIASKLDDWKLVPRPERLTELYFSEPTKLPATYKSGARQTVRFTVHNAEHQMTTYRYTVAARAADKEQIVGSGEFTLAHDVSKDVIEVITMPGYTSLTEMRVSLAYSGITFGQDVATPESQSIHYWVNRAP